MATKVEPMILTVMSSKGRPLTNPTKTRRKLAENHLSPVNQNTRARAHTHTHKRVSRNNSMWEILNTYDNYMIYIYDKIKFPA